MVSSNCTGCCAILFCCVQRLREQLEGAWEDDIEGEAHQAPSDCTCSKLKLTCKPDDILAGAPALCHSRIISCCRHNLHAIPTLSTTC